MKEHQKFFSVRNPATGRIEGFVTVANRETADHGATILAGNAKVLAARLSDAKFFWENDLRTVHAVGLEGMAAGLANVTFHNKLGSQADRIARIEALAREIAPWSAPRPTSRRKRRGWQRPICNPRWSANSPNCRASWAATTPAPLACPRRWRGLQGPLLAAGPIG
jgi:hypothetical protein